MVARSKLQSWWSSSFALPTALRLGDGYKTKYLMREIVERRVGPEVARRSKQGFSPPLFKNPAVRAQLQLRETVASTPCFDELPFSEGAREAVLDPNMRKLWWMFYALDKTYAQLRSGSYVGAETETSGSGLQRE